MKGFGGVKVGVKLIVSFLIVSAIAGVIGVRGILSMQTLNGLAEAMYNRQVLGLGFAKEANIDLVDVAAAEKNIILSPTQEERQKYKQQYDDSLKLLDVNLGKAKELTASDEGKKIIAQLLPALQDWKEASRSVVETAFSEPLDAARQSTVLSMGPASDKLAAASQAMEALTALKEKNAKAEADLTTSIYQGSMLVMICLVAAGVLFGIILGIVLTSGITRQLGTEPYRMMEIAQRISGGDLTIDLDGKNGRKPTGAFAALKEMKEKLTGMVNAIQESAEQVASSSEEITASAQKLAEGAQSQASTLEETSASIEELTASVDQVAEHAQSQAAAVEQGSAPCQQVQQSIEEVSENLQRSRGLPGKSAENCLGRHQGSAAGCRGDQPHRCQLGEDRRNRQRDLGYRRPDQPPGPQRFDRGGPRGRTRRGFRGGGRRGEQARRPQRLLHQGDRGPDQGERQERHRRA